MTCFRFLVHLERVLLCHLCKGLKIALATADLCAHFSSFNEAIGTCLTDRGWAPRRAALSIAQWFALRARGKWETRPSPESVSTKRHRAGRARSHARREPSFAVSYAQDIGSDLGIKAP